MSEQPAAGPDAGPTTDDAREPEQSPARQLVETISAYEVDPPPPERAREPD